MVIHIADTQENIDLEALNWDDFTWVNIVEPVEELKQYLARNLSFRPLDLDDCLSYVRRHKIDGSEDYLFLVLHFPLFSQSSHVSGSSQVSVFIYDRHLVTLHDGRLEPLVQLFAGCEKDAKRRSEFLGRGPAYLLYRIIDRLVDCCFPILNKVGENIGAVEKSNFSKTPRTTVMEISGLRRDVISLGRIMATVKATIGGLEPRLRRYGKGDLSSCFGDTIDHLDEIGEGLNSYKQAIESLNNAYDSLSSDRINGILRRLTILFDRWHVPHPRHQLLRHEHPTPRRC